MPSFLCPLILIVALASNPTPSSNHFQRIQGMSFQITKTGSKAVWFSDWKNLAFLPPVPQWGEKDTELRDLPTHYPSTSPRKLQTFLVPVSPMAISKPAGLCDSVKLMPSLEAIWLTEWACVNSWNLWHFSLLTRSGFKNVLHCCDSGIHTVTVLGTSF